MKIKKAKDKIKKNYYRADMNAPPKKIDTETQKEIFNRYDKGYSLKSITTFIMAKISISEDEAKKICEKTVVEYLRKCVWTAITEQNHLAKSVKSVHRHVGTNAAGTSSIKMSFIIRKNSYIQLKIQKCKYAW